MELVAVILIVAVLAAFALPRFANLGSTARANVAQAAGGALRNAAQLAHYAWALRSSDMGSVPVVLPDGSVVSMWRGYPDAGNCCAPDGIEAMIDTAGLDLIQPDNTRTRFEVRGAPTPAQCAAIYTEPAAVGASFTVQVITTGC